MLWMFHNIKRKYKTVYIHSKKIITIITLINLNVYNNYCGVKRNETYWNVLLFRYRKTRGW